MIEKETIINSQVIQNILKQEKGELPYWLDSPFYDIYWEWINDSKTAGSYQSWIRNQITSANSAERIERLADALTESLSINDGNSPCQDKNTE